MPTRLEGTSPLWIASRVLLSERVDDFFRRKDNALKTFAPEDIHDLRVASRRLREGLALFAPCYPPENIERIIKKVKRVTRLLGEMRNTDEALLFFNALAAEISDPCRNDLEKLQLSFEKNRIEELKRLRSGLGRIAPGSLRGRYLRLIIRPYLFNRPAKGGGDPFAPLSGFAASSLDERLSLVLGLVPQASQPGAIEAQHRLRIAIKHFRYRMEILSFLVGPHYQKLHSTVKGYQDVLGKLHDLDVFAAVTREADFSPEAARITLNAIAAKREKLFADFSGMLEAIPLETLGKRIRNAL